MNKIEQAYEMAFTAHFGQKYGSHEYMKHINDVVEIADRHGFTENQVIACYLHDVIEDTDVTYTQIKDKFGQEVADIVYYVTDELGRNRAERKEKTIAKLNSHRHAIAVKLCDRIANVRHSKENNESKFQMYLGEHKQFMELQHKHSYISLWSEYENLIK